MTPDSCKHSHKQRIQYLLQKILRLKAFNPLQKWHQSTFVLTLQENQQPTQPQLKIISKMHFICN